jgi:hypothetical protein
MTDGSFFLSLETGWGEGNHFLHAVAVDAVATKAIAPTVLVAQAGAPIVAKPGVMPADSLFAGENSKDQGVASSLFVALQFRLCFCFAGTNGIVPKRKRDLFGEFGMRASAETRRRITGKGMGVAFAGHCFF